MHHADLAVSYLNQFNSHHGWGVEIGLPLTLYPNLSYMLGTADGEVYELNGLWKRNLFPSVGGRYRLFAGNSFYIGLAVHLGMVREKFYADRYYAVDNWGQEVMPVYADYSLLSPFVRTSFETGFMANIGAKGFFSLNLRGGLQVAKSRVSTFGVIKMDRFETREFQTYHGLEALGSAGLSFGVKL